LEKVHAKHQKFNSSSTAASSTTSRPRAVEPSCGTRPRHPPTPGQPDGRSIPPFPHLQDIRLDAGGDGLPPGKPGKKGLRALLPDRSGNRSASASDVPDAPVYLAASDGRAANMTASTTAMQLDMDGTARKMYGSTDDDRLMMMNNLRSLLDDLISRFIHIFRDCHY